MGQRPLRMVPSGLPYYAHETLEFTCSLTSATSHRFPERRNTISILLRYVTHIAEFTGRTLIFDMSDHPTALVSILII